MVDELQQILEGLTFDCVFETLQLTNVFTMKGRLSAKRGAWLADIARHKALSPVERARYILHRYLSDGYLDCVKSWGLYDARLQTLVGEAAQSVQARSADALEKVDRAIVAIKAKGIP
jgi:DNA-directed RNA polymerase specialized sigma24 family protein